MAAEEVDGVLVAFGGEGWCAFEGIGDAELLVFVGTHGVVGEEFDALHIIIFSEVLGQGGETLVGVGVARHKDVANPGGFVDVAQMVEEGLVVVACVSGVGGVERVVEGLDVEQDEVGVLECQSGFLAENHAAGVEGGVESGLVAEEQKLDEKVGLHEGFAARAGDASSADEVFVAECFGQQFFGRPLVLHGAIHCPRVGVVAEGAPHGAALEEGYETDAGAIDGPERLDAVDFAEHGA